MFLISFHLAVPHSMQAPSSVTRDQTQALAMRVQSPNNWTAREVPESILMSSKVKYISSMNKDIGTFISLM